jgi:hypothetical protein
VDEVAFSLTRSPCVIFLWGYVKELVFVLPLPLDTNELKLRLVTILEAIDRNVLERVWDGLDYRLDICRVTNGARIKHL